MGDIFRALREGNEEEVIRLLDVDPALLEGENDDGDRPLVLAAEHGHLRVASLLIERGANINAHTGWMNRTALHCAAQRGHEDVVAFLLSKGAHTNVRSYNGVTPLLRACDYGHLCVVKMLVQCMGAQGLDDEDSDGWTALHYAAYSVHEGMVRCLLLAGADPTITDNGGRTPRDAAEGNHYTYTPRLRKRRARCVDVFQVRPLTC
jgi:ankyrin repeat protein